MSWFWDLVAIGAGVCICLFFVSLGLEFVFKAFAEGLQTIIAAREKPAREKKAG